MKCNITKLKCRTLLAVVALLLAACGGGVGNQNPAPAVNSYTVGGRVTGLSGTVVLQNNHGDNRTVTGNVAFTFANPVASGSAYNVTVLTHPAGQSCSVANGTGTISNAAVTNVIVNCAVPPPTGSCASEPMRSTGTKYYFCDCQATGRDPNCVPGNDAWDGLTPSTPKQNGWKARMTTIAAGDTVALCRGGSFLGNGNNTRNTNCSASATCDLRDYTDPRFTLTLAETRPYISSDRLVYLGGGASTQGYRYFNLQLTGNNGGQGLVMGYGAGGGITQTNVDLCNVRFHDTPIPIQFDATLSGLDRWTIRQSQFENCGYPLGGGQGILGATNNLTIDGNHFADTCYGTNTWFDHSIYLGTHGPVSNVRVVNNEIHTCRYDTPVAGNGFRTGTVAIVAHGQFEDLLIENNYISCDYPERVQIQSNWPIGVGTGGYGIPEYFRRTVIRRNVIVAGNAGIGIALDQAPDSVIEDNILYFNAQSGSSSEGAIAAAALQGTCTGCDVTNRATVRNNTIYYASTYTGTGIRVGLDGTGHNVTGNAIFFAGATGTCFSYPNAAGNYAYLSNNACNRTWGTIFDSNRITLTGSPFVSAPTNFTPATGTPLVGAASTAATCTVLGATNQACSSGVAANATTWSASDTAKTRIGTPTDVGAYER